MLGVRGKAVPGADEVSECRGENEARGYRRMMG